MRKIKFRQWDSNHKRMIDGAEIISDGHFRGFALSNFDKNAVMQFTGLKDANGKEIYEGDIVLIFHTPATVEFGYQDIGHDWQGIGFYTKDLDGQTFNIFGGNQIKVIGNIYNNPELLKKEYYG